MTLTYRPAVPEDADACVDLRGRTRENAFSITELARIGVTRDTWRDGIADGSLPGHVCLDDGQMVGYCFGAPETGEIVVLALLPAWEDRGIGRTLLDQMVADLHTRHGHHRLFLGCSADPAVRSYGFYRHLGWISTGQPDAHGDERLDYVFAGPAAGDM